MNRHCLKSLSLACLTTVCAGLTSCVDNNYDLSKDVDMTVTIGGDASLPGSNTEEITLKKILDLDANSNVQADANGNYQLMQSGNSTSTTFTIDRVGVNYVSINPGSTLVIPFSAPSGWSSQTPSVPFNISASFRINQNITTDVVALKSAETSIPTNIRLNVGSNSGTLYLESGTTITFPSYITLASESGSGFEVQDGHKLVCTSDQAVSSYSNLAGATITGIDFTKIPDGGLPNRGHLLIDGTVSISGKAYLTNVYSSSRASISLGGSIGYGTIDAAEAEVDPAINLYVSPVRITDLPDFLSDDQVTVDLTDPKVFIIVDNPTPVNVSLSAELVPVGGSGKSVKIGDVQGGTSAIVIPANVQNYTVCLHRQTDNAGITADEIISVPNMNDLIEKIPDEIRMNNIVARSTGYTKVNFGRSYNLYTGFSLVAPLQFNAGSKVVYTDRLDGWSGDMENVDFTSGEITLTATNKIPLALDIAVDALDENGNKIDGVTAVVDKQVAAGTTDKPAVTNVTITIKSDRPGLIEKLDGIEYRISATTTEAVSGTPLNENQTVKFDNIRVRVKGGVTVDMN